MMINALETHQSKSMDELYSDKGLIELGVQRKTSELAV